MHNYKNIEVVYRRRLLFSIKNNTFAVSDNPKGLHDDTVMDDIEKANEGKTT